MANRDNWDEAIIKLLETGESHDQAMARLLATDIVKVYSDWNKAERRLNDRGGEILVSTCRLFSVFMCSNIHYDIEEHAQEDVRAKMMELVDGITKEELERMSNANA